MRLLHAGDDHGGRDAASGQPDAVGARDPRRISGNFCRCTGYQHIVNAIQHAADKR